MMLFAAVIMSASALGQVELRGDEVAPPGQVVAMDEAGVHLGTGAGARTMVIGWDRVRRVHGQMPAEFAGTADKAWRARTRVERGDFIAAEPLLEDLFEPINKSVTIYGDNQSAIKLANNPVFHGRTKHIELEHIS